MDTNHKAAAINATRTRILDIIAKVCPTSGKANKFVIDSELFKLADVFYKAGIADAVQAQREAEMRKIDIE